MQISPLNSSNSHPAGSAGRISDSASPHDFSSDHLRALGENADKANASELRDKFQDFVGQTFFAEMIKSLRTSQKGSAYFNGGRAEEIFQGQFDQQMAEHLSDASAKAIADPMFELFQLGRTR